MLLKEYIAMVGDPIASQQLNISERTARAYRCEERMPHPATAKRIARILAHVPVTFEDCFACGEEII